MISDETLIKVTNRSKGSVGYTIPDMGNLHRRFEQDESKMIPAGEVRKLNWSAGGHELLANYLMIESIEMVTEILNEVEPEYNYTEEKIKDILLNGSLDDFLDTLDFAPEGVIDLMKDLAISLQIPDVRKRDALSQRTNTNISKAIEINNMSVSEEDKNKVPEVKHRRTAAAAPQVSTKERRTAVESKYKIVK